MPAPPPPLRNLRRRFRYGPRDLWSLSRTAVGRRKLTAGISWIAWPILGTVAALYRRTVLRRTPVIAVVGSFGKTTTTRAVLAALGLGEPRQRGNSWSYLALAVLAHGAGRPLVIEVGISRPRQMRRYARMLRPDLVVFTSIGDEHHISLGDLATTRAEKGQLLSGMAPRGIAILNGDDEQVMVAAAQADLGGRRVVCYGFGPQNQHRAERLALDWPRGSNFSLLGPDIALPVRLRLIGSHSVRAALAAFAVAHELAISAATAGARLSCLAPTSGRMQPVVLPSGAVLLRDDTKSALATYEAALDTLATIPARRRLAVLGEVTEPRGSQHVLYRALGARIAGMACRILFIGQRFDRLAQGARRAGLPPQAVSEHASVQEIAARLSSESLGEGDVVLLKGRLDQKLGRVALLLSGSAVECTLRSCRCDLPCERCPLCASGWGTRRPVT